MAKSLSERQGTFRERQDKRGLAPTPRGWVPKDKVWLVKSLIDRLYKNHREQPDIQQG